MEYVEGKTLKSLIKKRGALTLPEVQDIMVQLTSAIAHAHESYIVHRDIKPQNVIIMDDGRVKVMDFGIASQLNSNELTQTNSVMGTVYYLPPEQANGTASTFKSDIYSLGILMYELVTGSVPFKGDSPVEVAIKHMKNPLPSITDPYPEIPQSVENVILKASAKNPKNRYNSVLEMHDDLLTVLDKSRFDEPKVKYAYPENDFEDDMPKEKRSDRTKKKEENRKNKKMNKALIIIGSIIAVLVVAIVFITLIYPKFFARADVEIPDVTDMTVSQAEDVLEDKWFKVKDKTKKENSDEIEKGKVIETDPEIGRSVKEGTKITLTVSKGSEKIEIEDYTGQNYYEVKAKLEAAGLEVVTDEENIADTEDAEENVILGQDVEAGTKLAKGDIITLTIPNIYTTYPDITLEIKYQDSDNQNDGTIIYQNMSPGTMVNEGATLKITVVKKTAESSVE